MAEETEGSLMYTPTWAVAVVCTIFVTISLLLERGIHRLGKTLRKRNQKPLYEALEKLKEELMLLGFISLLLTVFQGTINRFCIPKRFTNHMLPCKRPESDEGPSSESMIHSRELIPFLGSNTRRLLSSGGSEGSHCKEVSFFSQFYGSVKKSDYSTLRLSFIEKHCRSNPTFNFHDYMMKTLEADFKKVVGISASLWGFVVIFLLLNIEGWHTYFWISFVPLILLLAVGAKLEHIITQLAQEVAEKHVAVVGNIVVEPSDKHFWFGRPKLVLYLIHFILFQNAFELAFFFWILTTYGFGSCIMGKIGFIIPRLVVGVVIQVLCSYSTLPLYALVTQMGTSFKSAIFEEHIHQGISVWQRKAKDKAKVKAMGRSSNKPEDDDKGSVQLLKINDTSIHGSETTERSESTIDIPKSS